MARSSEQIVVESSLEPLGTEHPTESTVLWLDQGLAEGREAELRHFRRELNMARQIQESLLPKVLPHLPGFELAGFCKSAHHVGGDFFDVISMGEKSALLLVADVMGKGVAAALFAASLRTLVRSLVQWAQGPGDLLARINRAMFQDLSSVDMFVTAQLVAVDLDQNTLTVANAGHCPMLVTTGAETEAVAPEGLPLGIMADAVFPETVLPLNTCKCVLLYTDGFSEARNASGAEFGVEGLRQTLGGMSLGQSSAEQLKQGLLSELALFEGLALVTDDRTCLLLKSNAQADLPAVPEMVVPGPIELPTPLPTPDYEPFLPARPQEAASLAVS